MAVSGIVCRSRLLCKIEIKNIWCNPAIINRTLLNDSKRKWRQCRKLTTSMALAEKHKKKNETTENKDDKEPDEDVSNSLRSDYITSDSEDVTITYYRGLPQVTVPLPSRRERCRFTLRPISNTVGDFLNMLKEEDRGIDRVSVLSTDGTRIASSNTIEVLLEEDFTLIINDSTYNVSTPTQEKLSAEEVKRLSDVRNLVHQLYEALNVREHQLHKERELCAHLENLRHQLQPLEQTRQELEVHAQRKGSVLAWAGLGLMSVQFGILARLTWWEYSWDIMEPVTYFVTYGTAMAAYAYFVLTKEEYILPDVKDRQHLFTLHKKAKKVGLDLTKYNLLKDQISTIETDLKRLRDPLHIHLPPERATSSISDIINNYKKATDKC
ncbi:Mitochondrial calcium uniporter [Carabus blaptoides fortunei]